MEDTSYRAIAIVGVGAILPDAPNVKAFWQNIKEGKYSITEVTPDRWDPAYYYDADHNAPDKTYSKIGGWVREYPWDPMKWRLPIPPRVAQAMDGSQHWGIACTREALEDYGYPGKPLDTERTAVILGNAMGGEKHYRTVLRVVFPEYADLLAKTATFAALPEKVRRAVESEFHQRIASELPEVTEDTMPGELANCIAGRIANIFNFHGPNFVTDAACASAMAAITASIEGLIEHKFDYAITGGIDRNMGASTFVKFCKIGALSATGTRPYAEGADGFVMGEGAALFLLKRLADAERDGDKIYAVFRGMAGASDGKGKGITAPNPVGQKICVERAWENAGLSPETVTLIEGHGTSTKVGDVVEVQGMMDVLNQFNLPKGSVALGSVKSNIGHLKAAAGAAGMLKAALAISEKVLPPSVHCSTPNPDIDFAHSPLYVNGELKPWTVKADTPRRAGVSAFGFGGTNFHAVLEEYIPGRLSADGKRSVAVGAIPEIAAREVVMNASTSSVSASAVLNKAPLRGAMVIGAATAKNLAERVGEVLKAAEGGFAPEPAPPKHADLSAPERIAIDYADAADLASKAAKAVKALAANQPAIWKALRAQGIFRGHGPAPKVAFLYTGQGSQYVNMLRTIKAMEPIVADTFAEADRVMTPLLGKPLTEFIYVDSNDTEAVAKAEDDLRQTAITQPAVLATDMAMTKLLAAYGIRPDMTMGHSLGEYGALVASGAFPFDEALEAVSARGREMTRVSMSDNGRMAAVFAPIAKIEEILKTIKGYVVVANINSDRQSVIGGASDAVEQAIAEFVKAGFEAVPLPVSHAFHTSIVSPASEPVRQTLQRLHLQSPQIPIVANVNGEFYPMGADVVPKMIEILGEQVAAPVQFIKGIRTLYDAGARVFVETGPKKALHGFVEDVLGDKDDVVAFFTNHPKIGDVASFNQALCGLYAAGLGQAFVEEAVKAEVAVAAEPVQAKVEEPAKAETTVAAVAASVETLQPVMQANEAAAAKDEVLETNHDGNGTTDAPASFVPVVITGASLGLPGTEHIFDDENVARILRGEQFISLIPERFRYAMLDKNITRLVKDESGSAAFETLHDVADSIKLAGRGGGFDPEKEFGISAERLAALDRVTQLAMAAGIDAMRDAGIPLVMRYKKTSIGTQLPDRWGLPDGMRDDTGVIFGSAFPGYDSFVEIMSRYFEDRARREQLAALEKLQAQSANGHSAMGTEIARQIEELRSKLGKEPYVFDRRFLFRTLSMGHSQFAEYIGARGPNTQINSACATTTQAVTLAEDWIRAGRCRRVIVISADDVTSDNMVEWFGAGFLASGAAATDEVVEDAAIPFDRRRHGLIMGMGAAALVVESAEAARERGIQPICEVLSTVTANSAFHGSRLDVQHIKGVMEDVIAQAERRGSISRHEAAPRMMFVSHETYTPARGGSASAEIFALRKVFGDSADKIVIANTKGFTGHAMATGIEDVVAVKALETGCVPPVANFKEIDPELGELNLSKGGDYPVEYALRLGAGFGSQISMALLHWVKTKDGVRRSPSELGYEYRITDPAAWNEWVTRMAGHPASEMEVVHRTLRVKDQQAAPRVAEAVKATAAKPVQVSIPQATAVAPAKEKPEAVPARAMAAAATVAVKPAPVAVAPPPAPVPPPAVATSAAPAAPSESVKERILNLAVEKTGYPKDMLDLDLDLEADLGVDTVKQAEMFAAIREIYNIPRDQNLKLRDFPTLAKVIQFVYDKRPDLLAGTAPAVAAVVEKKVEVEAPVAVVAPPTTPVTDAVSVKERILNLTVEKTGYPKDMLDLDLDLEADLGVDTVKQAEMFAAIREIYNIPRDQNLKLRDFPTLAKVIQFVYDKRPDLLAGTVPAAPVVEVATVVEKKVEVRQPVPPPPAPSVVDAESVRERILNLTVEKTGYPKDMLDLDLDLEADLGVDTVKQAEMFAAIREIYNIPRDQNLKLRDFPTLAKVIQFVYDKRPDLAAGAQTPVAPPVVEKKVEVAEIVAVTPPSSAIDAESVKERILNLTVEKTGYPKDMLDLDLDLEADLGVDTVKQAEMFAAIREIYNIPRDQNLKLRDFPTLAKVIQFVYDKRPDLLAGVQPAMPVVETKVDVAEPVVAPPTPPVMDAESVKERILNLTVEKTGYPKDMLDLELDLEADLGVDTVKQAEMFAAIREIYNIPRDQNLKLRDFPTLAKVIQFVYDKRPDLAGTAPAAPPKLETVAPAAAVAHEPVEVAASTVAPATTDDDVSADSIREKVLDIVAEKTGYPKDMLDVDLDLEADLGVDTVKQAEMFASVRAAYNIPREENLKLRDFPTLAHVIRFAQEKRAKSAQAASPVKPVTTKEVAAAAEPPKQKRTVVRPPAMSFDAADLVPRRVPIPNLRPPLNLCKPTGVSLGAGSRVVVMPDQGGVADALSAHLKSLGVEVLRIEGSPDAEALTALLKNWIAAGPVQGVYWLAALDNEGPLAQMDLAKWHEGLRVRVKLLYSTMRTLYEQVATPGTFLVSGTRLGGQHGYDEAGAVAPMGGAVAGFTKTYKREKNDVLAKVVDFGEKAETSEIAHLLIDETLRDPGAVEIGYKLGERWTVGLAERPVNDGEPGLVLNEDSVFVITGAAGSIVSAITADLAQASGGAFYLLDLVPEPDANNPDLKRFVNDKDGLKRDLFARIQARGERATPALVERELAALERAHAAQTAIDAVREAGGTANYFSVNLTDTTSVAAVIKQVRERSGRIDVLLHAAGIERSHFLPDKDQREFDLVFDVKSDGWFNLLHAIGEMPLGATVAFSSIAGRFGNGGQTDYSSANDLLCKYVSSFRTARPATRGIAIDWTAWGGIGMATRGSIPKMMELAGIDMLPPEAGVPWIRRELTMGATCGEVVVGKRLGMLLNEWDETGGLHTTLLHTPDEGGRWKQGPMIGRITGMTLHRGLTVEAKLDPKLQPFLHDHQIDGTPVLPGVMGVEAFAEAAASLLPGWQVEAVEDVNFLAPFKFYRGEPRTISVAAAIRPEGDALLAECRLTGTRQLPNQPAPQETTHFTARVRLSKQVFKAETSGKAGAQNGHTIEAADIYRVYFHGPAYQVLERAWRHGEHMIGMMSTSLPANHHPSEQPTLMAPRLIELCFQTAGLWEMSEKARMGLPLHIDRVSILQKPELATSSLYAVVTPAPDGTEFDAEVVDAAGTLYVKLTGYRTVALPSVVDFEPLKALQAVAA